MAGDRFKIGERVYETDALDEISLRDLMLFNSQAAAFGVTWSDVERIVTEMSELGEEGQSHPDVMLMVGVTIWAARRAAGEDVTFDQAVDVPMSRIVWLESPKDHKPKAVKRARSASARAALPAAEEGTAAVTQTTLEAQSVPA